MSIGIKNDNVLKNGNRTAVSFDPQNFTILKPLSKSYSPIIRVIVKIIWLLLSSVPSGKVIHDGAQSLWKFEKVVYPMLMILIVTGRRRFKKWYCWCCSHSHWWRKRGGNWCYSSKCGGHDQSWQENYCLETIASKAYLFLLDKLSDMKKKWKKKLQI